MPPVETVSRSVESSAVKAAAIDLSVAAGSAAPPTITSGVPHGGPPAPLASVAETPLSFGATVRPGGNPAFSRRHSEVAVRLTSTARAIAVQLTSTVARGVESTLRIGPGRSVARLVPGPARRLRGNVNDGLLAQRRRRIDWELVGRERLLRAWKGVLREHGLPAGEVRLVGIFGPAPLGALGSVALDASGNDAIVSLRRTRVPGPTGHVALARHVPTGRLLTVLIGDV